MADKQRNKLEEATYPDLDAMMEAYSSAAVAVAHDVFRQRLDYNSDSMVAFEASTLRIIRKARARTTITK